MKHRLIILTILLTAVFGASAQTVIKGDISTATGKDIVNSAMEFIGTPYRYGVMNPKRGFDCSGFTSYIYSRQNISLPRSSCDQFCKETEIKDPKDLQKGDLVFFSGRGGGKSRIGHVGIVTEVNPETGEFKFIHSACSSGVTITHSTEAYYAKRYVGACRVLEEKKEGAQQPYWAVPTFKFLE